MSFQVVDRKEDSSMEVQTEIDEFKANWKQSWDPAITAKALAEQTEAVLKIFEPIESSSAQSVPEDMDLDQN